MIVGGYDLHLYCDAAGCTRPDHLKPARFAGRNERECKRAARAKGWRFLPGKRLVVCPECNGKSGLAPGDHGKVE